MASDKGKKSSKTVTTIPANDDGTERKRALDIALAGIEKQFGKGAVIRMGERASRDIQVIPTGCLDLDMALGVGGLPRGRVVEIYGPVTLPSFAAQGSTLCPVASTAPVSCTLICPVGAQIAASYGRRNAAIAMLLADVPPVMICTAAPGWPHFSRITSAARRLYSSSP